MNLYCQVLHCPVHEIHSICHAGSWISATQLALTYLLDSQHSPCRLMNLCCCFYTALSTRSTTPVLPAYRFLLLTWSALSTRFTALFMLSHKSLLQSLHYPIYGIHSIWHAGSQFCTSVLYTTISMRFHSIRLAGSWIHAAVLVLPYPWDLQHLSY
jgi:hypothetical protein